MTDWRGVRTPGYSQKQLVNLGLLFVAYLVAAELAYAFYINPAVYPITAAVALAALVIEGIYLWPAILLAGMLSYFFHGSPLWITAVLAVANTVQPVVGAYVLSRLEFNALLQRTRDMFALVLVALTASAIVPTIIVVAYKLHAYSGGGSLPFSWRAYWIGHLFALLILAPFIIRWLVKPHFNRTNAQFTETILAFATLIGIDYAVFWSGHPTVAGLPLIYLVLAPLFWFALRLGPRFMSLALVVTAAMTVTGTVFAPATASLLPLGERLVQIQVFCEVLAIIFFVLCGIEHERRYAVWRMQEHVKQLQDALRRISSEDRAKGQFLAVLAHELRNPLAPILSSLEILKIKGVHAAESDELVELMTERVHTMGRLLDDLLDISRISENKFTLQRQPVELSRMIEQCVQTVDAFARSRSQTVAISLSDSPVYVEADPVRIEQIIVNILNNAIKYTGNGGRIDIDLSRDNQDAMIKIKDTGIGIAPDMINRIFDPFVQASTVHTHSSGLGIGLSLSRMLVQMHGGTVTVRSEGLGMGSEFVIRLPAKAAPVAYTASNLEVPRTVVGSKRILMVDDNEFAARSLAKLLQHKGHHVDIAFNGIEATTKVRTLKPDVVLLDIGLPDIDGYEVARQLLHDERYAGRMIALTGYGQDEDKRKAKEAGFHDHMTKPVSIKDIELMLQDVETSSS